MLIFMQLPRLG